MIVFYVALAFFICAAIAIMVAVVIAVGRGRRITQLEDELKTLRGLRDGHIRERARIEGENARLRQYAPEAEDPVTFGEMWEGYKAITNKEEDETDETIPE